MQEIWINLEHTSNHAHDIIAISNTGLIKHRNGITEISKLRSHTRVNGKDKYISIILAEHFIPKTEEDIALGRDWVDHITHNPIDMNINDIRNLRWCTAKENANFKEAKCKHSEAMKGKKHSEEHKRKISESMKRYRESIYL